MQTDNLKILFSLHFFLTPIPITKFKLFHFAVKTKYHEIAAGALGDPTLTLRPHLIVYLDLPAEEVKKRVAVSVGTSLLDWRCRILHGRG